MHILALPVTPELFNGTTVALNATPPSHSESSSASDTVGCIRNKHNAMVASRSRLKVIEAFLLS
jgi:hypothetical protein